MARQITERQRYPDARVKAMDEFWELLRNEPDWSPGHIDANTLRTLGIARSKEPNAVFALEFLGIIGKDGVPSEEFQNLREDFQGTLGRLVRAAYALLLETIPLSRITQKTLVSFFMVRGYSEETAEYQAKLFVKLAKDAAISLPNVEERFSRARFSRKHPAGEEAA